MFFCYINEPWSFKLKNIETIDNSSIKSDFSKTYHQQAANLNDSGQNIEFIFVKINNYYQIGKVCLQYVLTLKKDAANAVDSILKDEDVNRLVKTALHILSKRQKFQQLVVVIMSIKIM